MRLTRHALDRSKERIGLGKDAANRLAAIALERGLCHDETTGNLRKFIDKSYLDHGKGNNIRIYAEKIFIFHDVTLITVFQLPKSLWRAAIKLMERKRQELRESAVLRE